jgi:hypothetical protein
MEILSITVTSSSNIYFVVKIIVLKRFKFFQFGKSSQPGKLGVMVQSLVWSQESSMLAAMQV